MLRVQEREGRERLACKLLVGRRRERDEDGGDHERVTEAGASDGSEDVDGGPLESRSRRHRRIEDLFEVPLSDGTPHAVEKGH